MPMEPMSWWQFILNNPEWTGVVANAIFAVTTIGVIIWQVCVVKGQVRMMEWQGKNSERNERTQNRLIKLQHEHEWVIQQNQERKQILKLGRSLYLAVNGLKKAPSDVDVIFWNKTWDRVSVLNDRLSILDVATFMGSNDDWFFELKQYVDAVIAVVLKDSDYHPEIPRNDSPAPETVSALMDVNERCKPVQIFLHLEAAIRMEFNDFKNKWDAQLSS